MKHISVTVNGVSHEGEVEPRTLLVHFIREQLGLTGTNVGCDTSSCGACTVLLDGKPVISCLTLAASAMDRDVVTIEGLMPAHIQEGGEGADPVQDAFDRFGALQCGFCQPGMMLSARALLNRNASPTRREIQDALAGNLCRCTGYTQILQAVELCVAEAAGTAPVQPAWAVQREEGGD